MKAKLALLAMVAFVADPYVRIAHGECYTSQIMPASLANCSCADNACASGTADTTRAYWYCVDVLPGATGQTVCNTEPEVVGSRVNCITTLNQGVIYAILAETVVCEVSFYICLAGCAGFSIATLGAAAPPCVIGCIVLLTACAVAVSGNALPDCWMTICAADYASSEDITQDVAISMGGIQCTGPAAG